MGARSKNRTINTEPRIEKYDMRILAKGIESTTNPLISKLNNNIMVIGGSGSGKTGGYVVPNIQNATGSIIVCDTKNQLERHYRKMLVDRGYKVRKLDFVNTSTSFGYNPLDYVGRYSDGRIREQDVLSIATVLCPATNHHEPIWDLSARSYIAFLIAFCLEAIKDKEKHNMITVSELHRKFCQSSGENTFAAWVDRHRDTFAAKKYCEIMANREADKMFASIIGFANEALAPFVYREAENIFAKTNYIIDIHELGKEKYALFVNTSDTDRVFDMSVNLFFTQALQTLCKDADAKMDGKLDVPVHIMLDDFACSGQIPNFDKIISVIRSRDISVSLILQSLSQLESVYDEKIAQTIVNNCDRWVYLGGQDMDTVNKIAERANKTPESILCMPRDKEYLIINGEKAVLVDKVEPYSTVQPWG